jgi:hypothetical protein
MTYLTLRIGEYFGSLAPSLQSSSIYPYSVLRTSSVLFYVLFYYVKLRSKVLRVVRYLGFQLETVGLLLRTPYMLSFIPLHFNSES